MSSPHDGFQPAKLPHTFHKISALQSGGDLISQQQAQPEHLAPFRSGKLSKVDVLLKISKWTNYSVSLYKTRRNRFKIFSANPNSDHDSKGNQ
jgi:hypothetical protein